MKKCKQCERDLDESEFYKCTQVGTNGVRYPYLDSYCKICRIAYQTDRRRQIKQQCVEYLGGKCLDCGLKTDRHEAYDFHHLDPDAKDFALGRNAKSFVSCKGELDKCVLLCAICHRFRHADMNKPL